MHRLDPACPPAEILQDLDGAERQLISLVTRLYRGDWDDMAEDLRRRQAGRPYVFRLDLDLARAIEAAAVFRDYERARGERLSDALPEETP